MGTISVEDAAIAFIEYDSLVIEQQLDGPGDNKKQDHRRARVPCDFVAGDVARELPADSSRAFSMDGCVPQSRVASIRNPSASVARVLSESVAWHDNHANSARGSIHAFPHCPTARAVHSGATAVYDISLVRDPFYLSIGELDRAYASGSISPVEVVTGALDRIERLDPVLKSYITLTPDSALDDARAAERRLVRKERLGPLDGVPFGLKDIFDTAGVRTTGSSPIYADRVPVTDATVVQRLKAGGAVLLGKHASYELALTREPNGAFPLPVNPWDVQMVPGGSSSGSAVAVAAGLCFGAFGSDTGGSIRLPSSYTGVVGLRPTFGLVSRAGMMPCAWSLDMAGPMARTVEDVAHLLDAVAGYDPADPASIDIAAPHYAAALSTGAKVRVGAPIRYVENADGLEPETLDAYRRALDAVEELGATVVEIELPAELRHLAAVAWTMILSEAFAAQQVNVREHPEGFGRRFYARMQEAALLTSADYVQALRGRSLIARAMALLMQSIDLLALPTTPQTAWRIEEDDVPRNRVPFAQPFALTGQPAVSVPCGFSQNGLPIGLTFAARPGEDARALAVAHAYERAAGWWMRHPDLRRLDSA